MPHAKEPQEKDDVQGHATWLVGYPKHYDLLTQSNLNLWKLATYR